ncbi:regulator of G-protein signaling [Acrasis kona]|uniref:Regulator of G-protein signaling n=1 Tax=Acrasis kona TaxID=1008807 RepID=A0AAW2Z2K4_9EUKA
MRLTRYIRILTKFSRRHSLYSFFFIMFLQTAYWLMVTGIFVLSGRTNYFTASGCQLEVYYTVCSLAPFLIYTIVLVVFVVFATIKVRDVWGIGRDLTISCIVHICTAILHVLLGAFKQVPLFFPTGILVIIPILFDNTYNVLRPCIKLILISGMDRGEELVKDDLIDGWIDKDIEHMLEDSLLRSDLKKFATHSFCPEDINCWEEIQSFRNSQQQEEKVKKALCVVDRYLCKDSPMELNIPNPNVYERLITSNVRNVMENVSTNDDSMANIEDALSRIETMVKYNMEDVLKRYKTSKSRRPSVVIRQYI